MAEALVSTILQMLAKVAMKNAQEEFRLVTCVDEEISTIERNLKAIRALLEDAEEKQLKEKEHSIKHWVGNLKAALYDMEDALDQWNTELLKLKVCHTQPQQVSLGKRKVRAVINFCNQLYINRQIGNKIKKIKKDLDEIAMQKDRYQLTIREIKQPRQLETTSFVNLSDLHGRGEVKKEIISKLLSRAGDHGGVIDCQTISIVGMGGIGKTSLAQMIFKDVKVRAYFDKTIWVCVSNFFDPIKTARAILESFDDLEVLKLPQISLETILNRISVKVKDKKIFLIFDDVWTDQDEEWVSLKAVLKGSMPGSRILVTTRKDSVAKVMGSSHTFHLEQLSDDVCWLILKQEAFIGRLVSECEKLEDIGREIAKKCKGLPLAAKTLGSLLREKTSRNEWQSVLNSELWKLKIAEEFIFTPLLLSYYDLPPTIRQCLLYCAIFPKDYVIKKSKLILHWMAQGYLNCDESPEMESKGEEYFNYLVARSFFQDFTMSNSGMVYDCKMHDLIYDFVQFLTKDEVVSMEVNCSESLRINLVSKKVRHLRLTIEEGDDFSMSIKGVEKLRSFVTDERMFTKHIASSEALRRLFNEAKHLRLMSFSPHGVGIQKLPKEISQLIHLRYLNMSRNIKLASLPEAVCELYNLQYLNLMNCTSLEQLPDGIWKLINLRYLYTFSCHKLRYYPKGIGKLALLRRMDTVIARVDGISGDTKQFSIGDFENLDLLRGQLEMRLVGKEINRKEARRAKLQNKNLLNYLFICIEREILKKDEVVQALQLPPNLRMSFNHVPSIYQGSTGSG